MDNSISCPRLIEVALPIREISAESVRDKSLRHGHISTLHLWWARRPLSAARAVVFASLVPDPDDPNCSSVFREAVLDRLKQHVPTILTRYYRGREEIIDNDPYCPYDGIPDTPRNRLLTFIAKWSREYIEFEAGKRSTAPKPEELLDPRSLVRWETSDSENPQGREILNIARHLITVAYDGVTPTVLDPFAGGGAIPLEAGRLGCQAIANDYNPVAYLILRATCEFPQRNGRPGRRKVIIEEFNRREIREVYVPNVLVHDVENWAHWMLEHARERIGHLYPVGMDGLPVVGYLWARTAPCSNLTCRGNIPLLRSLLICNKNDKKVALAMDVDERQKTIRFGIAKDVEITHTEGTALSRAVKCPFCHQSTSVDNVKRASFEGNLGERIVAVITDGKNGKEYREVEESDINAFQEAQLFVDESSIPQETMQEIPDLVSGRGWNFKTWGSLFNPRQLVAMQTFVDCLHQALDAMKEEIKDEEYRKAVGTYLGLWVSKIASRLSNVGIWHTKGEKLEHPFGRQAIPMTWDYPEANPFSESTGSSLGQLNWILRVLKHESNTNNPGIVHYGDGAFIPLEDAPIHVGITDPPYFDAIAYSDLSDFFYIWLKRSLRDVFPDVFITPLTPKNDEATALKHRHHGSEEEADNHFRRKLTEVLLEIHRTLKPGGIVSIMFAHQSTKAWTSLIHAIFDAGLTVDATWPIDTEMITALKASMSSLSSSVTVACRPRIIGSAAAFQDIRKEIEQVVHNSVKRFWEYGVRGADLIVACYGPAVGVFGKYERVEKADGTRVEIPELLEFAKKAARDAIAGDFKGDNLSTLYYVWANLYGSSEQAWDDARLVVQIGGDEDNAMDVARRFGIFVVDGSKCRLALLADRADRRGLGSDQTPPLIDALHHTMLLWKEEKRGELVTYLGERRFLEDGPFWKLAQSLFDVLPRETEDWKIINTLLKERGTLLIEGRGRGVVKPQTDLFE